jgi:membrane-bound serine protease (ClpP class)
VFSGIHFILLLAKYQRLSALPLWLRILSLSLYLVLIPVLVIVGLKLLARSPVTLRKTLSRKEGVSSQSSELGSYIDMQGTAVTDLRPAGKAVINGKRVDVVTRGEYLEKDSAIIVIAVTGNQIIVRKKDKP